MICVVDASVAVKWFAQGDWAWGENNVEPALEILKTSARSTLDFYQPPHFWQKLRQCHHVWHENRAQQCIDDLAQLNITWAAPTAAYPRAIEPDPSLLARNNYCRFAGQNKARTVASSGLSGLLGA